MGETGDGDRGDTLVEVIAAITVVSLTSAALFSALATAAGLAGRERSDAVLDGAVRRVAEEFVAAGGACTPGEPLTLDDVSAGGSSGSRAGPQVKVEVDDGAGGVPMCPAPGRTRPVRITVATPDGRVDRTQIVIGGVIGGSP